MKKKKKNLIKINDILNILIILIISFYYNTINLFSI